VIVLAIDTATRRVGVALGTADGVLASVELGGAAAEGPPRHAEQLAPAIEFVCDQAQIPLAAIDVIGVGIGPGNFTGIRIAVAAARGLALSLGIPAVGVTATEAASLDLPRPCRIVLPLRADQVAWQDFGQGAGDHPQQSAADALPPGPAPALPRVPPAVAIARIALARRADPGRRPAPFYLRPADAAPARDASPLILP